MIYNELAVFLRICFEIESALYVFQPLVYEAKLAVGNIKPESLSEIRSLRMPPDVIRDILEGVLRLMGIFDTSWVSMKRYVFEIMKNVTSLMHYTFLYILKYLLFCFLNGTSSNYLVAHFALISQDALCNNISRSNTFFLSPQWLFKNVKRGEKESLKIF